MSVELALTPLAKPEPDKRLIHVTPLGKHEPDAKNHTRTKFDLKKHPYID